MKKVIALVMGVSIILGVGGSAQAKSSYSVNRISGLNRYETSINIANNFTSDKLKSVIVASGDNFPDALSASLLSKKENAPILLIGKDADSNEKSINFIKSKLDSSGTIYILGGESSVSKSFETCISNLGYNIKRLGGTNRFDTNSIITNYLNVSKGTPVIIVNAFGFADALSVSSSAVSKGYPVIMTDDIKLPNEAKKILKDIEPNKVFIIGGEGSVKNTVISELQRVIPSLTTSNIIRIGGSNRYNTSLILCKYFKLSSDTAIIANGKNFPDALSGSALAAKENCPVILTDGDSISNQKEYLDSSNYEKLILLGGTGTINEDIEYTLENKPVLSDTDIKKIIVSGDGAFQQMLKTNVDGNSYTNISGVSYARVKDNTSFYKSVQEYLNKKYGFSNYYTDRFINSTVDFVFTAVNDELYMRYGNPEPAISAESSQIISKKYDGNKLYVKIKGYYGGDESIVDATLIYNGNVWLIDKFDNWGVE